MVGRGKQAQSLRERPGPPRGRASGLRACLVRTQCRRRWSYGGSVREVGAVQPPGFGIVFQVRGTRMTVAEEGAVLSAAPAPIFRLSLRPAEAAPGVPSGAGRRGSVVPRRGAQTTARGCLAGHLLWPGLAAAGLERRRPARTAHVSRPGAQPLLGTPGPPDRSLSKAGSGRARRVPGRRPENSVEPRLPDTVHGFFPLGPEFLRLLFFRNLRSGVRRPCPSVGRRVPLGGVQ